MLTKIDLCRGIGRETDHAMAVFVPTYALSAGRSRSPPDFKIDNSQLAMIIVVFRLSRSGLREQQRSGVGYSGWLD